MKYSMVEPFDSFNCPFRFYKALVIEIDGRAYGLDAVYPFYTVVIEMPYTDIKEYFSHLEDRYVL